MQEEALSKLWEISPMLGLLFLAVIGLITFIVLIDKRNLKITDERIADVKSECTYYKQQIKEFREESKEDKRILSQALDSFNTSVKEFKGVSKDLTDIKVELGSIKRDVEDIKRR